MKAPCQFAELQPSQAIQVGAQERKHRLIELAIFVIMKSFLVSEDVLSAGEAKSDKSIGYGQETFHCLTNSVNFSLLSQLGIG